MLLEYATPFNIAAILLLLNMWAFLIFGYDKIKAEGGGQRVAEQSLLLCALIGGTLGAYLGRFVFRHKTRKQPFSSHLHQIAIIQLIAIAAAFGWIVAGS